MALVNLGDLLDRNGDPDQISLIDLDGGHGPGDIASRHLTYRAVDEAVMAVSRALVRAGISRGDRVAILSANRAEYLFTLFGAIRAGMVAVPVNFKLPQTAIDHVIADSGAVLAFCDAERLAFLPESLRTVEFGNAGAGGFDAFIDPGPFETVPTAPDDTALLLYTSGSSGRPKGVPLAHGGQIWTVEVRLRSDRNPSHHRLLVAAPFYHMNGLLISLFAHAAHASEVMLRQFRADSYIHAAERYRCTWLTSVPTMLALVIREEEILAAADLSSVEIISYGSAPVTDNLVAALEARFPQARLVNGYGTTESGAVTFGAHPKGLTRPPMALGYPLPEVTVRLVRGDGRIGYEGVLHVKSPALMPGYHNLPEKSAEAITGDGFYITGDVMRRDENGFYYFVGRADDMFVCGGENIFPLEVEAILTRHPAVDQACVVPVADDIRGQLPVAFVVRRFGAELTEQEVKDYALANATPQEHPRRVFFLDALPLAGTNKIDRAALIARACTLFQ